MILISSGAMKRPSAAYARWATDPATDRDLSPVSSVTRVTCVTDLLCHLHHILTSLTRASAVPETTVPLISRW